MDRTKLMRVNWIVYGIALFAGLTLMIDVFYETANPGTGYDAGQSMFSMSFNETRMYSLISLFFVVLLIFLWKRIAPYHVAALTFVTSVLLHNLILSVTIGWVGVAATVILFFGVLLTLGMLIFTFFANRRLKKQVLAGK